MLDLYDIPNNALKVFTFNGTSPLNAANFIAWQKPRGMTMLHILLIGAGGTGGTGVIGANSTGAGGGGGGSGAQASLLIPLSLLPDTLYLSMISESTATGSFASTISIYPDNLANNRLLIARGGGIGGNGAGATAGAAGAAAAIPTIAECPLAGLGICNFIAGQAGIIGGTTVAGANLTRPVTGLVVTGGTGGGGLPAAAATGTNGGGFVATGYPFPPMSGGVGSATATAPADRGRNGAAMFNGLTYFDGGTGGASTHGTATGAGLVQSSGGSGAFGCGGGGCGGALTGSTAGKAGRGGPSFARFICW